MILRNGKFSGKILRKIFWKIFRTGTSHHYLLFIPADDDDIWVWQALVEWWYWQGKPKNSEKTRPNATLSTTNPTCTDHGANPGLHNEKPATNCLSHGTAAQAVSRSRKPMFASSAVHMRFILGEMALEQIFSEYRYPSLQRASLSAASLEFLLTLRKYNIMLLILVSECLPLCITHLVLYFSGTN
jgi:hypothetical protein